MTSALLTLVLARGSEAAPRDGDAAQQWFTHGLAAARAGDLPAARRAFGAAYALVPSVDILWNLAAVERKLGDSVAALEHLRLYVASPDARPDRKQLAADELLPELEAATAHLALAEPEGTIALVDGREVPATAALDLTPGVHAITVRRNGTDRTWALYLNASVITRVPAVTVISAPAATPSSGAASAGPAASGLVVARAPSSAPVVLTLGSAALVSIAAGVYFSFLARDAQETGDRLEVQLRTDNLSCRRSGTLCDDFNSARSSAQRSSLLGTTLLVSGGILGGAAISTWLLWPGTKATRLAPTAAKDAAGVVMTGTF